MAAPCKVYAAQIEAGKRSLPLRQTHDFSRPTSW